MAVFAIYYLGDSVKQVVVAGVQTADVRNKK
jgi:hypothetical protein